MYWKADVNISVLLSDMRLNNANTLEHQSFPSTFLIVLLVYLLSSSNALHVALGSTPFQNRQNNAPSSSLFFPFFCFWQPIWALSPTEQMFAIRVWLLILLSSMRVYWSISTCLYRGYIRMCVCVCVLSLPYTTTLQCLRARDSAPGRLQHTRERRRSE